MSTTNSSNTVQLLVPPAVIDSAGGYLVWHGGLVSSPGVVALSLHVEEPIDRMGTGLVEAPSKLVPFRFQIAISARDNDNVLPISSSVMGGGAINSVQATFAASVGGFSWRAARLRIAEEKLAIEHEIDFDWRQ